MILRRVLLFKYVMTHAGSQYGHNGRTPHAKTAADLRNKRSDPSKTCIIGARLTMLERAIAKGNPSVCPSLRPSVTLVINA